VSCFSFYLFSFFVYKVGEQEGRKRGASVGGGGDGERGLEGEYNVKSVYTCM
jgi:hypothetical protein